MEHAGTVRWSSPASLLVAGGDGQGRVRVKACSLDGPGVTGVRVLHFPAVGAETRWILLFDGVSGERLPIVDEAATYGDRSFASVALLAHRVRVDPVDTVAILGAGRIARAALPYVAHRFPGAAVEIAARRPPAPPPAPPPPPRPRAPPPRRARDADVVLDGRPDGAGRLRVHERDRADRPRAMGRPRGGGRVPRAPRARACAVRRRGPAGRGPSRAAGRGARRCVRPRSLPTGGRDDG